MEFNTLTTTILILSLVLITQVIALFIQYKVNKNYRGIGYWLLGSGLLALGFLFMSLINFKSLIILVIISNSLIILGEIYLYIGVKKFLNMSKKVDKWKPISIFFAFNLIYYYFMLINNNISYRTFAIVITLILLSFMISYQLFFKRDKDISTSANFTAFIFFLYGSFNVFRLFHIERINLLNPYIDQTNILMMTFIVSIILTTLWTFGFIIMLNQRIHNDKQLEKEKLELIFNTSIDAQLITRLDDGFIVDVNESFLVLTGYKKEEVNNTYVSKINLWHKPEDRILFIEELKKNEECKNREFIFHRKDQSQFIGLISAKIIIINSIDHIISVIRDITVRKEFEKAIIESEEKYRSILDASPDDITITDLEGKILMISPAAKEIFGYESDFDSFIGMQLLEFIIPQDVERAKANIKKMYQGSNLKATEYRGIKKDRSIFDIEVNSRFIYDANGHPAKMLFIIRDISERKAAELKIKKLLEQLENEKNLAQLNSITDSLTGLVNRGYFDETLTKEFSRMKRSCKKLSLIMLDIDYFKKYNDTYGHQAGDKCLKIISDALKKIVERGSDIVARYGGEEFIVILPETDEKGAEILAERLRTAIEDLAVPHSTSDISKYVTVSLGVVTIDPKDLISQEEALKFVDEALYKAKKTGRNKSVVSSKNKL